MRACGSKYEKSDPRTKVAGYIKSRRASVGVGRRGERGVICRLVCVVLLTSIDLLAVGAPFRRVGIESGSMGEKQFRMEFVKYSGRYQQAIFEIENRR